MLGTDEASKRSSSVSEVIRLGPRIMAMSAIETSETIRGTLIMLYSEGLSRAEISRLGISKSTVSLWIQRHQATASTRETRPVVGAQDARWREI